MLWLLYDCLVYTKNDECEATFTYEDLEVYDKAINELKAMIAEE